MKERELTGLGNEVAIADKGVRGLSTVGLAGVSLLMLFCGSERGDGLWTGRFMVFGRREDTGRGGSSDPDLDRDFAPWRFCCFDASSLQKKLYQLDGARSSPEILTPKS